MRLIYSWLLYLLAPLVPLYLKKRGKKNSHYLLNWNERFAVNLINPSSKPILWLHSVSVGETRAMHQLVELIHTQLRDYQILITTMTPTGRETAKKLYPYALVHYLPYDLDYAVKKFYKTFQPKIGIIMETEIWPNLIHFAAKNTIPLLLVNARLSLKSYLGYRRFKWLLMPILNKITAILCQDSSTKDNFAKLGYTGELAVIGNTKFDLLFNAQLAATIEKFKALFGERQVICFASTRDGEESLILDNLDNTSKFIYLLIPRHPERFSLVEKLLQDRQLKYQKRSDNQRIQADTQYVIGDSLGEMLAYYAISYLAVIGGSFKDFGGQNPIEALYMHKPVIFGPSMYNFKQVAADALAFPCAIQVPGLDDIQSLLNKLSLNSELYERYQANCSGFIKKYQGASQKVFAAIKQYK